MQFAPQEIIDHVVDFCHADPTALCSARLVSRAWNISARVHLFRCLDLLISEPPKSPLVCAAAPTVQGSSSSGPALKPKQGIRKFTTFLEIIETSKDIPHCVREVIIGNTNQLPCNDDKSERYSHLLSAILAHLHRVATLYLREIAWAQLHPAFLSLILDACQSPSLEHLDVWNCQMSSMSSLMEFLSFSNGITSLRLSHIRVLNLSLDQDMQHPMRLGLGQVRRPTTAVRRPLKRLTVDSVPLAPMLYALLATTPGSVDLAQVQRLCLNHINDAASVRHFLQAAGTAVEHLELRASSCQTKHHSSDSADLTHTPRLRHLRISGLQWTQSLCPAECIANLFVNIPDSLKHSTHPLESIDLFVNVIRRRSLFQLDPSSSSSSSDVSTPKDFDCEQWSLLDTILSHSTFSSLQKIKIHMTSLRAGDVDTQSLLAAFPQLNATRAGAMGGRVQVIEESTF